MIRIFLIGIVLYTLISLWYQYIQIQVVGNQIKLQNGLKVKLHAWYTNIFHNDYDFDSDPEFNSHIDTILKEYNGDPDLWSIMKDDGEIRKTLVVDVPQFFREKDNEKEKDDKHNDGKDDKDNEMEKLDELGKLEELEDLDELESLENLEKLETLAENGDTGTDSSVSKRETTPRMLPFDPRFSMAVYFDYIASHPNKPIDFHWSDWVDLLKLEKFIFTNEPNKCEQLFDISGNEELIRDSEIKQIGEYCKTHVGSDLGFKIIDNPGLQTIENNEIIGKLYLYSTFETPTKLVLLDGKGNHEIEIAYRKNDLGCGLLYNGYVDVTKDKMDIMQSYDAMVKTFEYKKTPEIKPEIRLEKSMFLFDAKSKIDHLKSQESLTTNQKLYLESLMNSIKEDDPPKFFHEASLLKSYKENWLGEHYDWRFFNGLTVGKSEQMISLHKLIKAYLEFCINEGLVTWIAHGSLLSWYWNGLVFPWDTDLDVQMPIGELNKLAEHFNQSLVIELISKNGHFNGMGKYFIDISSSITYREKGNGNNNIDARFIDVDTGLYVDITGLSITNTPRPSRFEYLEPKFADVSGQENFNANQKHGLANCRNKHFIKIDEIEILRPIHFQNQLTYIPTNFLIMINNEYDLELITEKNYRDYIYLKNFRTWVNTQNILDYLHEPDNWISNQRQTLQKRVIGTAEKFQINQLNYQDYKNLLYDKQILKQYIMSRNDSRFHQQELDLIMYNKPGIPIPNDNYFPLDLFLNKIFETGWDYNSQIDRISKLSNM